ncbi:hypothetical protein BC828DRAFT_382317 [Blastocladiella britannica]|nr:hypothetical protein BC828DRAFT_382317 [Blastocladiella britannica]
MNHLANQGPAEDRRPSALLKKLLNKVRQRSSSQLSTSSPAPPRIDRMDSALTPPGSETDVTSRTDQLAGGATGRPEVNEDTEEVGSNAPQHSWPFAEHDLAHFSHRATVLALASLQAPLIPMWSRAVGRDGSPFTAGPSTSTTSAAASPTTSNPASPGATSTTSTTTTTAQAQPFGFSLAHKVSLHTYTHRSRIEYPPDSLTAAAAHADSLTYSERIAVMWVAQWRWDRAAKRLRTAASANPNVVDDTSVQAAFGQFRCAFDVWLRAAGALVTAEMSEPVAQAVLAPVVAAARDHIPTSHRSTLSGRMFAEPVVLAALALAARTGTPLAGQEQSDYYPGDHHPALVTKALALVAAIDSVRARAADLVDATVVSCGAWPRRYLPPGHRGMWAPISDAARVYVEFSVAWIRTMGLAFRAPVLSTTTASAASDIGVDETPAAHVMGTGPRILRRTGAELSMRLRVARAISPAGVFARSIRRAIVYMPPNPAPLDISPPINAQGQPIGRAPHGMDLAQLQRMMCQALVWLRTNAPDTFELATVDMDPAALVAVPRLAVVFAATTADTAAARRCRWYAGQDGGFTSIRAHIDIPESESPPAATGPVDANGVITAALAAATLDPQQQSDDAAKADIAPSSTVAKIDRDAILRAIVGLSCDDETQLQALKPLCRHRRVRLETSGATGIPPLSQAMVSHRRRPTHDTHATSHVQVHAPPPLLHRRTRSMPWHASHGLMSTSILKSVALTKRLSMAHSKTNGAKDGEHVHGSDDHNAECPPVDVDDHGEKPGKPTRSRSTSSHYYCLACHTHAAETKRVASLACAVGDRLHPRSLAVVALQNALDQVELESTKEVTDAAVADPSDLNAVVGPHMEWRVRMPVAYRAVTGVPLSYLEQVNPRTIVRFGMQGAWRRRFM